MIRALRGAVCLLLVLALLAAGPGALAAEEESALREMLAREKAWIRTDQGPDGEIYVNRTQPGQAGDVNPYFACQAARGLLAGDVSGDDLACVGRYLAWHTERFVAARGEITNYRLTEEGLASTGHRDSVDSYVALYVSLLSEYALHGGDIYAIPQIKTALFYAALKLSSLTAGGLAKVSEDNGTVYLMDNAEVWEACRLAEEMFGPEDPLGLGAVFRQIGDSVADGIRRRLWNGAESRYEIGLDGSGAPLAFGGWDSLYPEQLAQLFCVVCGLDEGGDGHAAALYGAFCGAFDWEHFQLGDTDFAWAVLAYAAARFGDRDRAGTYLAQYRQRFDADRSYPFYAAEAGWAARACGLLLDAGGA